MCFRPTDPSNLQAQQLIAWFGPTLGELIEVDVSSESTSWVAQLAEMMGMGVEPAQLRLISGGKDYSSNAMVLRDVSFGNSTIHFQVRWETRQPYRAAPLLLVWRSAEFQRALPAKNFKPGGRNLRGAAVKRVQRRALSSNSTALISLACSIVRWPPRACEDITIKTWNCSSACETSLRLQVSLRPASWAGDAAPETASESLSQYLASQVGAAMPACAVISQCMTLPPRTPLQGWRAGLLCAGR